MDRTGDEQRTAASNSEKAKSSDAESSPVAASRAIPQPSTDLRQLLMNMKPQLNDGEYVFITIPYSNAEEFYEKITPPHRVKIICEFKEEEGITLIMERQLAQQLNLAYTYVASWITLKVHSSLEAVGLTAMFSKALSDKGISANVIAGYHHDHIFVNVQDGPSAVQALEKLSRESSSS